MTTRKFFGTDGIRGLSNTAPMDAECVLKLGIAAGHFFTQGAHRHTVVIGKDTRLSGYMVEPALTAGFISVGMNVLLVGPLPTPAVAMITRSMRADLGVMISASHNPYQDNGIKLFNPNGTKLSDETELAIEALMQQDQKKLLVSPDKLGRAKRLDDAAGRYIEYVKQTFPKQLRLDGMKIVIDCANGAAYKLAPTILWELGAEVVELGVDPDGFNINHECGSTHPELLAAKVKEHKAQLGIALDGDADRVIICDEKGTVVDGDKLMAAIAVYWHEKGLLEGGGLVATQMSNLGMEQYLASNGLKLVRTQVGDRYVVEAMRSGGFNLGGEQSGHIIFNDYTTTGDGLIAALQILSLLVEKGKPASKVLHPFTPLPQVMKNVRCERMAENVLENGAFKTALQTAESSLGNSGRVFVRKSGTEPVVRIMVEGNSRDVIEEISTSLANVLQAQA